MNHTSSTFLKKTGNAFICAYLPHTNSLIISDRFPMQSARGHASLIIQTGQRSQTLIMWQEVKGQPEGSQKSRQWKGTGRIWQQILLTNQTWLVSTVRELITGNAAGSEKSPLKGKILCETVTHVAYVSMWLYRRVIENNLSKQELHLSFTNTTYSNQFIYINQWWNIQCVQ